MRGAISDSMTFVECRLISKKALPPETCLIREATDSSNILFISEGTPGRASMVNLLYSIVTAGAVPTGLGNGLLLLEFEPS